MTHNAFRRREFLESCIVRGLLVGATALSQNSKNVKLFSVPQRHGTTRR